MPTDVERTLIKLGLSQPEARMYLSMLKSGPQSVQVLAREARISRTAAYDVIASLLRRGLATTTIRGVKKAYAAEDPEKLEAYFDQHIKAFTSEVDTLRRCAPELRMLQGGLDARPRMRFLSGMNGFRAMFRDVEMVAPEELLEVINCEKIASCLSIPELNDARSVVDTARTKLFILQKGRPHDALRNLPCRHMIAEFVDFHGGLWIYANRVAFLHDPGRLEVVIIDNQAFAHVLRALFYFVWNVSPDFNRDEARTL